jgi:hypothetical protein
MTDSTNASPATTEAPKTEKRKRGPNKPLQGKFEIEFLKETAAPERKPLQGGGGGERDTVLSKTLRALAEHPGVLAVIFQSPDPKEVFTRRVSLIAAADRLGIKLDEKNTASRSFVKDGVQQKDESGKDLYALYAMVAAS